MKRAGDTTIRPAWGADEERAFAEEVTALNLKRCRIAAIAGLMVIFWSTIVNLTVPGLGFAEYWAWIAICTGIYALLLLGGWRVARAGVSPVVQRWFVSVFVISLLVICDGFGFVLSTRLPSVASISRGVLLVALIFVIPPSRFILLAVANELVLTVWVLWRGADATTLTVFVDGTVSMIVGVIASWLLYEAKRAEFLQRRQLERHTRDMDELMAITAHDLRSPLLGMKNLLALASSRVGIERERLIAVIGDAVRGCDRMLGFVNNLVAAHAVEQGAPARLEPGDVREPLRAAVERARASAEAKGIRVDFRVPDAEARAAFEERALAQVFDNLLGNALKFSPAGATVEVELVAREAAWRVEFRDEGPGVAEAERQRLFEKYRRGSARPTGGEAGTGLGLFIVRTLAERMRASVAYEPREPRGACFAMILPRAAAGECGA